MNKNKLLYEKLEVHCKLNNIKYKDFIIEALNEKLLKEYNITEETANKIDKIVD